MNSSKEPAIASHDWSKSSLFLFGTFGRRVLLFQMNILARRERIVGAARFAFEIRSLLDGEILVQKITFNVSGGLQGYP